MDILKLFRLSSKIEIKRRQYGDTHPPFSIGKEIIYASTKRNMLIVKFNIKTIKPHLHRK